jgi:hypothetical protein
VLDWFVPASAIPLLPWRAHFLAPQTGTEPSNSLVINLVGKEKPQGVGSFGRGKTLGWDP